MIYKVFLAFTLVLISLTPVTAQKKSSKKIQVTGMVTDPNGLPIKRAVIYVDSVKTFSKTNKKGYYKVRIGPETKHFMVFSPKHGMYGIAYDGITALNFQFKKSVDHLTEANLADLGFTIEAPRKGTIDPSRFKEYGSIFDLIQEMFTGIEVKGERIVVRGVSSFSQNPPLFIVDGSYVNSIAFVNPVEVQSIELIKDGTAALYGARGANGVIVINLKK
jgi:TonB-dependent SusC/RagA subfamily outer membrane receptor